MCVVGEGEVLFLELSCSCVNSLETKFYLINVPQCVKMSHVWWCENARCCTTALQISIKNTVTSSLAAATVRG